MTVVSRRAIPFSYADRPGLAVASGPTWLSALRERAHARYREQGLPSTKVEDWKFTNLQPLARLNLTPAPLLTLDRARLGAALPAGLAGPRLVLGNGRRMTELDDLASLGAGIEIRSWADAVAAAPDALRDSLDRAVAGGQPLDALNAAYAEDGLLIRFRNDHKAEAPLHIVHLGSSGDEQAAVAFHPRLVVLVEAGAQATIIESHIGLDGGTYWAQPVADIVLGEGAVLRHIKLQEEGAGAVHTGLVKVTIGARASFDGFTLSLGGRLGRSEVRAVFTGEEGTCLLNGVYLGRDRQHMDMTTDIDHAVPRCRSREVFKGVLDDAGRGVFLGRIVVRPGAQGTDGHQLNRVLLLSDAAESDTKPMLEIFADDVKCSHGAAVGALDADALHYLRARGIGETEARRLLIEAFAGEAIDLIAEEPVRDHIRARVTAWLDRAEGAAA